MKVNPATGFLEIKNGLCGIVIPWKQAESKKEFKYAPIQSVIYTDGQHSDNTINLLYAPTDPVSFQPSIIKQNQDEITVLLVYKFLKPKFAFEGQIYRGAEAGPGYYRCTITVKKNQKSIIILEEADYEISYLFKISNGLDPDKARYRGWSSSSPKYGYEPGGGVYRDENTRPYPMDATVDLDFSKNNYYEQLSLWDQAGGEQNTGRYWMVFNSKSKGSNLFGFFQGRPSLLIGARLSGPRLWINPDDNLNKQPNDAEILVSIERRTADNLWFPQKRYQWGIYISNTSEILSPEKDQPIAKEMNLRSALGATIVLKASKPVRLNPSFYQSAIYLPASEVIKIIDRIKKDEVYYNHLIQLDGENRDIWDAWRSKDLAKSILNRILQMKNELVENYQTGDGTFRKNTRYWIGVRNFKTTALTISGLFADKSILITPKEKKELEQLMGLMARILWDDDNVPLADNSGVNRGPANMVHQYINNGRNFFALLLSKDPEFAVRASKIPAGVKAEMQQVIFPNGSSFGSPHYTQTGIDPIWFTCMQIRQAGLIDLFKDPRVKQYAYFLTSLLTPPSCRFNGNRKMISFGDGSEESAGSFGLLANGLKSIDPVFANQLLSIYYNGPPNNIFAGPSTLAIVNEYTPPSKSLNLTDCSYDGYATQFRLGANSRLESALWVLNGETFYDHRGDDRGETAIYALGAPLSLSRSSFYMPLAQSSKIRSMVIPIIKFPEWAQNDQAIFSGMLHGASWTKSNQLEYASLKNSVITRIQMTNPDSSHWFRNIMEIHVTDSLPVYVFYDSTSVESIWSMMMMSDGPVQTPAGPITPIKKLHNNVDSKELPSGTAAQTMNKGWNTFDFTGQPWRLHPYGGINWSVQTYNSAAVQFSLADWATTWQTTNESNDYKKTNLADYKEEQQILRIKMNSPLINIITPTLKGQKNPFQIVSKGPNYIKYQIQNKTVEIYPSAYHLASDESHTMAWFGPGPELTMNNISVQGGTIEINQRGKNISCYLNGSSGTRTIIFPYKINSVKPSNDVFIKPVGQGTRVMINFKTPGMNQPIGTVHYTEFKFVQS
ncbi:MAG: hypothetical protein ABI761_14265 [Saprospiraceae bacterium]